MPKILQISTFRPEKCGIASWTEDKIDYCHKEDPEVRNRVVAVNGHRKPSEYSDFVEFCMDKHDFEDYEKAADFINSDEETELVSVQHEYGIFGGRRGQYIIPFLKMIKKPTMATVHTVLKGNSKAQDLQLRREILAQMLNIVDGAVVISNTSKKILTDEYGVDPSKLNVILHGTHDFPESVEHSKKVLGLEDRTILSTVGFVREMRGLEYSIGALPEVIEQNPDLLYVIAGASHPNEIANGREYYREMLENQVSKLGLKDNVKFVNKHLSPESLLRHINASDICLTPYKSKTQVSSGVLSYCIGLGKPVISTPFPYAQEILGEGRGILLPDFYNSESIAESLIDVLSHPEKIEEMEKRIGEFNEQMRWPNVAKQYLEVEKKLMVKA